MKKRIKLYSVDKTLYPDKLIMAEVVDNINMDTMASNDVIYATKTSVVDVRDARLGEVVNTIPKVRYEDKIYIVHETSITVTQEHVIAGAKVIINPIGEEFLISSKKNFDTQYKKVNGGYVSNDGVNVFRRSLGNYVISSSWGQQVVLKDSFFCVTNSNRVYGITNVAFENDYKVVNMN